MRGIGEQPVEIETGCVVERVPGSFPELGVEVLEPPFQLGVGVKNFPLCPLEHAIEAPEDRQRQDHVLVLAALEGVADQIRHTPKKTYDFAVVHIPPRNYLNRN
jgi:hypothetical protein